MPAALPARLSLPDQTRFVVACTLIISLTPLKGSDQERSRVIKRPIPLLLLV